MCIRQASMFNDLRSGLIAHGFTNIEYNIINSIKGIDHLHKLENVSPHIPVHQENHEDKAVEILNGGKDHFFILDSCNRLVYQVILPWSFLYHPYVKAAILSAYNDNPCGECHADGKQNSDEPIIATLKHLNRPLPEIFSVAFASEEELEKSKGRPLENKHLYYKNHHHHHHHHEHPYGHHYSHHHHHHIRDHPHSHHHHYKYHNFNGENYNTLTSDEQYDALKLFLLQHLLLLDIKNDTFAVHSQGEEIDYHKYTNTTVTHNSQHTHKVTEEGSKTDIFGDAVVHTEELTNVPQGIDPIRIEHLNHNIESEHSTISKDEILSQDSPPLKIILWYPHYHTADGQRLRDHYYIILNSKDPKYHGHVLSDTSKEKQHDVNFEGQKEQTNEGATIHHHHGEFHSHHANKTQGIITNVQKEKDEEQHLQTDFTNHTTIGQSGLITNLHQNENNACAIEFNNLNVQTLNQHHVHTEQVTSTNLHAAESNSGSHHEIKGTSESDHTVSHQHKNVLTDSDLHHQDHVVSNTEQDFVTGGSLIHNFESNTETNVSYSKVGESGHHYSEHQDSAKQSHLKDEHASNSDGSYHKDKFDAEQNVVHHSSGLKGESSTVLHDEKKHEHKHEHNGESHYEITHESGNQTFTNVISQDATTNTIKNEHEGLEVNHSGHGSSNYLSTGSSDKISGAHSDSFEGDKLIGGDQKVTGSDNVHSTGSNYHIAGQESVDSTNIFQQHQGGSQSSSFSQSSSSSYSSSSASSYSHSEGSAFSDNVHVKEEKGTDGSGFHKDHIGNNNENSHGISSSVNSNASIIHGQTHGNEQNNFSNQGIDSSVTQQYGQHSGNTQHYGSTHSESYNQNVLESTSNANKENNNIKAQHYSSQKFTGGAEKHIETDSTHNIQKGSENHLYEGTSTGHEESHHQYGTSVHHNETDSASTHQSETQSHGSGFDNKEVSQVHATQGGSYGSSVSQGHGSEYSKKVTTGIHGTDEGSLSQSHSYDQNKKYSSSSSSTQLSATQTQSHGSGYSDKNASGVHVIQGGNYGSSVSQNNTYDQAHKTSSGDYQTFKSSKGNQQHSHHTESHVKKDKKKGPGEYDDRILFPDNDSEAASKYHKSLPKTYHHVSREQKHLRTLDEENVENGEPKEEDEVVDHYSKMLDWIEFPVD